MSKLNTLAKMIRNAQRNEVAEAFVDDLLYSIEQDNKNERPKSKSYKPSGISGCERALYYELIGAPHDINPISVELVGICETGTERHETIQNYIMNMKYNNIDCEWLDVGKYLDKQGITDPVVIEKNGNETKLYREKYNMRFMCDGLIRYKGELYILEIKTESTHKFKQHDEPWDSHKQQATCYAMTLQVPRVIFLYENRDTTAKKGYLVEVTPAMIHRVESVIDRVNTFIRDNIVPPPQISKCNYCNYKNQCALDGGVI